MVKSTLEGGRPPKATVKGIAFAPQQDDPRRFQATMLSDEEVAAIREKARLTVELERKDKLEKAYLAQFIQEERELAIPEEEKIPIFLSLAGHANYIMLDGTQYFHEHTYHVTRDVFRVLTEQINRGWAHEDQTEVRDARTRRRFHPPAGIGYGNYLSPQAQRDLEISAGTLQGSNPAAVLGIRGSVEGLSA